MRSAEDEKNLVRGVLVIVAVASLLAWGITKDVGLYGTSAALGWIAAISFLLSVLA